MEGIQANRSYDYLVVGAGLYGAAAARVLADNGFSVLVVEKRDHIAGNAYTEKAYTENAGGICLHKYGAHIFHTDDDKVWEFVNRFARFNDFVNSPIANYKGEYYPLPFNMNTFEAMWGVSDANEARQIIERQIREAGFAEPGFVPSNLEEQAISMVGTDIYEKLIRGYTEKQWGRPCTELPASIIRRIPVRYEYNNNYFNDRYQGIPECGYTEMVRAMLDGIDVLTGTDFLDPDVRSELEEAADHIIFSGQIDEYFGYRYGPLGYRSLRFETERVCDELPFTGSNGGRFYQQSAVINYTDRETPWTRIIEHRHFTEDAEGTDAEADLRRDGCTIITREYPDPWEPGKEPFYPVRDEASMERYAKYKKLADSEGHSDAGSISGAGPIKKIIFGGRLGTYRYYDMDDVIAAAISDAEMLIAGRK